MPKPQQTPDGRSRWAIAKKRHLRRILERVGRSLDEDEMVLATRTAALFVSLDQMAEAIIRGQTTPTIANEIVRLNHAVNRNVAKLGAAKVKAGRRARQGLSVTDLERRP